MKLFVLEAATFSSPLNFFLFQNLLLNYLMLGNEKQVQGRKRAVRTMGAGKIVGTPKDLNVQLSTHLSRS